jgi:phage terminase large subunit-like protein
VTISAPHTVDSYVQGCLDGSIIVNEAIIQAIDRHINDMNDPECEFEYVPEIAEKYIKFIELFRLSDQDYTEEGLPPRFVLLPYHRFMVAMIHGWRLKSDHSVRRFNDVYFQVARKNAKSTIVAALMVASFYLDKKQRAQFWTAAMSREQAGEVFEMCKAIIDWLCKEYKTIKDRTHVTDHRVVDLVTKSFIGKLSKQANTIEGKGMYVGSLDEYHVHPNNSIVSSMKKGSIKHLSAIIYRLTTPGDDMGKPCYDHYLYCKKILSGAIKNDRVYVQIHELDDENEVHNMDMWVKPNPGLGHTCHLSAIEAEYQEATSKGGSAMADFKTKHLGMWVGSATEWIRNDHITACMQDFDYREWIVGKELYGGVDIAYSDVGDICSASFYSPIDDKTGQSFNLYWIPETKLKTSNEIDYLRAQENNHIIVTPGDMTDYNRILTDLIEINTIQKIKSIYFDPWNISYFYGQMVDAGLPVEKYSQNIGNMSPPSKRIAEMINAREIIMQNNPVTRWMFSNVLVKDMGSGMIKLMRVDRKRKIDGVVALIIAYSCYMNIKLTQKKYNPTIISLN